MASATEQDEKKKPMASHVIARGEDEGDEKPSREQLPAAPDEARLWRRRQFAEACCERVSRSVSEARSRVGAGKPVRRRIALADDSASLRRNEQVRKAYLGETD